MHQVWEVGGLSIDGGQQIQPPFTDPTQTCTSNSTGVGPSRPPLRHRAQMPYLEEASRTAPSPHGAAQAFLARLHQQEEGKRWAGLLESDTDNLLAFH